MKLDKKQIISLMISTVSLISFLTDVGVKKLHYFSSPQLEDVRPDFDPSLNSIFNGRENDVYNIILKDGYTEALTRGEVNKKTPRINDEIILKNGRHLYVNSKTDNLATYASEVTFALGGGLFVFATKEKQRKEDEARRQKRLENRRRQGLSRR